MVEQEHNKISDKAMLSRMVISVSVILVCLAALSFSACAWFSCNVSSGQNTLCAANCGVDVTVISSPYESEEISEDSVYYLVNGEYKAQLTRTGNASSGFCIVRVTTEDEEIFYHTLQIPEDTGLTLHLKLFDLTEPAELEFIPSFGTSVYYGTTGEPLYLEENYLEITRAPDN